MGEYTGTGHEDDYVIELANEVRKVLLELGGVPKENKLLSLTPVKMKTSLGAVTLDSPLKKVNALAGAITMDS